MKIRNSLFRFIKVSSFSLWCTVLGLVFLLFMFFINFNDNNQIDGYKIEMLIFTGYMLFIWLPIIIFYLNYLLNSGNRTYQIDLNKKSISYYQGTFNKKIYFQDISQTIKTEHINHKKQIDDPTSFWDRLENSIGKNQRTMPWSKFSYIKILGKNGEKIILTSLMTNYEKFQIENMETKYVRFPLIRNK